MCTISVPFQVTPFTTSVMYSFEGVCDYWLVAPSIATNGVEFSVIANFVEDDPNNGGVVVKYGEAQYVSFVTGKLETIFYLAMCTLSRMTQPTQSNFVT